MKKQQLTRVQNKRVIILKDALKQIKLKSYIAETECGYVNANYKSNIDNEIDDLENKLSKEGKDTSKIELRDSLKDLVNPEKPCQVCARGALLLSSISKFNNYSLEKAYAGGLDSNARDVTARIFGKKNSELMENFFENNSVNDETSEEGAKREIFREKYPDETDRLKAILRNAIRNNGTFKP